jgi:uncharacterized NAD(P)/FAD-binding protein YdhS
MQRSIVIVGGGLTGAAAAVQLVRASPEPLEIRVIEPRAELGRGMAYSAEDPDHRLNGSSGTHFIDPADPGALTRWCESTRLLERDPEALAPNGNLYIRRADFGRFVGETVAASGRVPSGSTIAHVRSRAVDLVDHADGIEIRTDDGSRIAAAACILATGNGGQRVPWPFDALASHPALIADAFDLDRVRRINHDAHVLVVGAGLTALDILSTLVRRGHAGPVAAISRHGLRPRPQRPPNPESAAARLLERIQGPVPPFIANAPRTARGYLHALRAAIRAAGDDWYGPFDEVRDTVWKLWPMLDVREKKRFLRRLRPWYDVHRFRTPPQNEALVREAELGGRVTFHRAHVLSTRPVGDRIEVAWVDPATGARSTRAFDAVINCTGLDASCGAHDNPLLAGLLARGVLQRDATGFGFEVDARCRPVSRVGTAHPRLRMLGPPTAGSFGDPLGVLFIAPQVARVVPDLLDRLPRG